MHYPDVGVFRRRSVEVLTLLPSASTYGNQLSGVRIKGFGSTAITNSRNVGTLRPFTYAVLSVQIKTSCLPT